MDRLFSSLILILNADIQMFILLIKKKKPLDHYFTNISKP